MGTALDGTPVWEFLLDPAIPFHQRHFQGVQPAPSSVSQEWPDDAVLLMDWVGEQFYSSIPCFVAEIRRMGLSRKIQLGMDFASFTGKTVYLLMVHPKAVVEWRGELQAQATYRYCKIGTGEHFPQCLYHLWPLACRLHKKELMLYATKTLIQAPSFRWNPFGVFVDGVDGRPVLAKMPGVRYQPGFFAVFPITHLECVEYIADNKVYDAGLPVEIVGS